MGFQISNEKIRPAANGYQGYGAVDIRPYRLFVWNYAPKQRSDILAFASLWIGVCDWTDFYVFALASPVFLPPVEVEGTELKHDRAGVLSMEPRPSALDDPNPTPCTSQFAVTLKRCPERDGQCCVFGRLIRGFGALREIEKVATGSRQQPIQAVSLGFRV